MEAPHNNLPNEKNIYRIINRVKFTPREIDILACILAGRSAKTIGVRLTLSRRTVENYIQNIKDKLKCNSQENIRDFLEKADEIEFLRRHYLALTNSDGNTPSLEPSHLPFSFIREKNYRKYFQVSSKKRWYLLISVCLLSIFFCGAFLYIFFSSFSQSYSNNITTESIRSDLALPSTSSLIDRSELIAEIESKLKDKNRIKTLALVGIGGSGKTIIARSYAHTQHLPVVWELNAESSKSLKTSFEDLACALAKTEGDKNTLRAFQEIKDADQKRKNVVQFVKNRLRAYQPWLLIYNNVYNVEDVAPYFPTDSNTWGNGKIILTTRDRTLQNNKHIHHILYINELSDEQKFSLFINILYSEQLPEDFNKEKVLKFLKEIPPFPLDVSIAADYLKTMGISFENYLERLREHEKEFESVQERILKETGDYTKTRYGIIICSLKNLISLHQDFKDILVFITFIDPQNIPRYLLEAYKDKITVDNFIYNLQKYSLIVGESIPSLLSTFSIHRSTQSVSLAYLNKKLETEKNKNYLHPVAAILEDSTSKANEKEELWKKKSLVSHGETFLTHQYVGTLGREIGYAYHLLGNYEKAKKMLENSLQDIKNNYNLNDIQLAKTYAYLGIVYRKLGEYNKAEVSLQESLRIYKAHCASDALEVGWVLAHLGNVYRNLGQFEKARNILEQSVYIQKIHSSENHSTFIRALTYLGITYKNLAYYEKAKEYLEKSMKLYRKHIPENHSFNWVNVNLGDLYRELGKYQEAKNILEESLAIQKKYFPETHSDIVWISFLLAKLYGDLGNYDRAISLFKEVILAYEKTIGKEHINMGKALRSLGQTYLLKNDIKQAEIFLDKALHIFQQNKYSECYMVLEDLGKLYLEKSQDAKNKGDLNQSNVFKNRSLDYLNKALNGVKTHFSASSPHTVRIQHKIKVISGQPDITPL